MHVYNYFDRFVGGVRAYSEKIHEACHHHDKTTGLATAATIICV